MLPYPINKVSNIKSCVLARATLKYKTHNVQTCPKRSFLGEKCKKKQFLNCGHVQTLPIAGQRGVGFIFFLIEAIPHIQNLKDFGLLSLKTKKLLSIKVEFIYHDKLTNKFKMAIRPKKDLILGKLFSQSVVTKKIIFGRKFSGPFFLTHISFRRLVCQNFA